MPKLQKAIAKVDPPQQERNIRLAPRCSSALQTCHFRLPVKTYWLQMLSYPPHCRTWYLGSASTCSSSTKTSPPSTVPELTDAQPQGHNLMSLSTGTQTQSRMLLRTSPVPPSPSHRPRRSPWNTSPADRDTLCCTIQKSLTMLWSDCPLHVTSLIVAAGGNWGPSSNVICTELYKDRILLGPSGQGRKEIRSLVKA